MSASNMGHGPVNYSMGLQAEVNSGRANASMGSSSTDRAAKIIERTALLSTLGPERVLLIAQGLNLTHQWLGYWPGRITRKSNPAE